MKKLITMCAYAALAIACGWGAKAVKDTFSSHKTVTVKAPASIPAGNKAPSEAFLIEYANFKELQKQVTELEMDSKLVEKKKLLRGTIDDLNDKIPAGYTWDEDTKTFKPRQLAPAPPPEIKK